MAMDRKDPTVGKGEARTIAQIERAIVRLRGQDVMLDADLAALYGVDVKVLNQAVRRNVSRFPADFMFQLTVEEANSLRSQFVTLNVGRGTHRKLMSPPTTPPATRCGAR